MQEDKERRRHRDIGFGWIAVTAIAILLGAVLWTTQRRDVSPSEGAIGQSGLTKPIRLLAEQPGPDRELLLALRVHHYRAQPAGEARYLDTFYDTRNWDLYREGYSYRFRAAQAGDAGGKYSVRLEREPRFLAQDEDKIDLRSDLPAVLGEAIAAGSWQLAVSRGKGLEAPESLRRLLRELTIELDSVKPRLRGEMLRQRFDITDKGQTWFELDSEQWRFWLADSPAEEMPFSTWNFVLDTRLESNHPELPRRVKTMVLMSGMLDKIQRTDLAPHEQAIRALRVGGG